MSHSLVFKSSPSLISLAEKTALEKVFNTPYMPDKPHSEKAFYLVKDDGIYIMPAFSVPEGTPSSQRLVIFAEGFDPDTNEHCWEDARLAVGGDDFAELLIVGSLLPKIIAGGDLRVSITETQISLSVTEV